MGQRRFCTCRDFLFEFFTLCGLRAGARGAPGKLEHAMAHNDDLTKRPRVTDRVKRPEHRGVQRSSRQVDSKIRHPSRAREKKRDRISRGRGVEEAQRGNVVCTRAREYEWGHGNGLTYETSAACVAMRRSGGARGRPPTTSVAPARPAYSNRPPEPLDC